jgi:hypothetical protein
MNHLNSLRLDDMGTIPATRLTIFDKAMNLCETILNDQRHIMKKSCFYILTLNGVLVGARMRAPSSIGVEDEVDALIRVVVGDDMDADNLRSEDAEGVLFVLTVGFSVISITDIAAVDAVTLSRVFIWLFDGQCINMRHSVSEDARQRIHASIQRT